MALNWLLNAYSYKEDRY